MPTTRDSREIFVARQPILDGENELFAYELLFRDSATAGLADFPDASRATARVAIDTFLSMGVSAVLGPCRGFLNVDLEMLASEAIEALPADRFVLEILETVPAWAIDRCLELRQKGFELALDDYVPGDPREALLGSADYVKVDLTLTDRAELPDLVRTLRKSRARLLAEKVETRAEFEACRELGFELFQGYFFAKPTTLSGTQLSATRAGLITAFRAVSEDRPLGALEEVFKRETRLGVQLLRIANSAALGSRQKITSFEHAIMYVGRHQLRRWILMMLYAADGDASSVNPVIELAAIRGRLLELLAPLVSTWGPSEAMAKEGAFLAGMLSLGDAILSGSLPEVIAELCVAPEVESAVLDRRGVLGALLSVAEAVEEGRFAELAELLDSLGLSVDQLGHAQREAWGWFRQAGADEVLTGAR